MNGFRSGFVLIGGTNETRIEMKLMRNVLFVATLVALNASAQPAPQPFFPPAKAPPAVGPGSAPGKMPPGLMHPQQPTTPPVMPDKEKLGYAIGFNIGSSAKKDGFDVLKEMAQLGLLPKIPVLVFSTLGQEDDVEKARKLGARGYVNKSFFDFDALYARILEISKTN